MAGAEGLGPSPEELGEPVAPTTPETPVEQPPVDNTEKAEEPKGFKDRVKESFDNVKEKIRDNKEKAEQRRNIARARERRIKGYAEIIKHGARSPQELQDLLADISFKDLKEAQDRNKYGSSAVGKLKAFLAGESDIQINDDEQVQNYYKSLNTLRQELGREPNKQEHAERLGITTEQLDQIHLLEDSNTLKEAGRRIASSFINRRTAASAGMYLALGVITGGFGWAAGGVLLGGVAGRGVAEIGQLFSGKIRESRENVLFAEKARWERMQALALQIRSSNEDAVTQGALTKELIDLMYKQGENALVRNLGEQEKELAAREAKFDKLRNRLQTVGELTGAVAGVSNLLNGGVEKIDMDFFNKVDGQSVFHGVQQTESGWQFLYTSAAERFDVAAQNIHGYPLHIIESAGKFGAHALEATTSQVIAYTVAERTLPMLLASWFANSDQTRDTRDFLTARGLDRFDSNTFYAKAEKDGKKYIYTREEDGSYKKWEWEESEVKDGDKTKKVKKLVGKDVAEKDVPAVFKERFVDQVGAQQSRNAERLTNQMSEYIRSVADQNHNPIPENPREFTYDWNEQPSSIDAIDPKLDHWYPFLNVNGKDEPYVDPTTGRVVEVAVLGVDKINNRIAIARFERAANGTEHVPVEVMRLDQFLKNYHLHLNAKEGTPFQVENSPTPNDNGVIDADFREVTDDENQSESSQTKDDGTLTSPKPDKVDPEVVTELNKTEGDKLEKAFLKDSNEDPKSPSPKPPTEPKDSVPTKPETKKTNSETLEPPEDFENLTKRDQFDWLRDFIGQLDDSVQDKANVLAGMEKNPGKQWKDWEFIQFQNADGKDKVLNRYAYFEKGKKKYGYEILTRYKVVKDGGEEEIKEHHYFATKHSIESFTEQILSQINETLKSGVSIPKAELPPVEFEDVVDDSNGVIPLKHDGKETKIDRSKKKKDSPASDDDSRLLSGMRRTKENPDDDFEDLDDIDAEESSAVAEPSTPAPVVSRGADFDSTLGARVKGLESLKASLPEAAEPAPEPPIAEPKPQDLADFLESKNLGPDNFAEGQKINFRENADPAIIQEIRSNLDIPDGQELNSADVSVLLAEGKEDDFDITLVRKDGDQDKDYTISLRRLAEVVE